MHDRWMKEALKQAAIAFRKDEIPVGAVVVFEEQIIGRGYNQVEGLKDPTAHAEMIAITAAATTLEKKWLSRATLYVTLEPCAMCAGAMVLSRLNTVVYGASEPKTGAHSSLYNLLNDPRANHRIEVVPGILKGECKAIMKAFFEAVRARN